MSELYEKSIIKLELDQVLKLLSDCAGSDAGKNACLQLHPTDDIDDVRLLLAETTAASVLSTRKGYPGFAGARDVSEALDRANRGGVLNNKELLDIAGVLRCARSVKAYVEEEDVPNIVAPLFAALSSNKYLEERIFSAIISDRVIMSIISPVSAMPRPLRKRTIWNCSSSPPTARSLPPPMASGQGKRRKLPMWPKPLPHGRWPIFRAAIPTPASGSWRCPAP